jgi:muramoyltetrapeptide carboxypeptidase
MRELRRPRRLVPGDRVAVAAPAGPVDQERLAAGVDVLRGWGLAVDLLPGTTGRHEVLPYLAGDDVARAKEFRFAWLDPSYAAVFCARGGYGVQRMLPFLDPAELTAPEPKVLVGFSDVTALHEVFNAAGIVTVHGPMAGSVEQLRTSGDRLRALLFEPDGVTDLLAPHGATTIVGGRASGRLLGGNLALLAASLGTPTSLVPDGDVVVLEDVGEDAYRLDRLVTQLLRAGWFDGVAGVVLGSFTEAPDPEVADVVLVERLEPLGVPMVSGAAIGHTPANLAVPLGAPVALDADDRTLTPDGCPLH